MFFGIIKPTQHHVVARFAAGEITLIFKNGLNKYTILQIANGSL